MLVVMDPPLQAVRALSHGGRAHFKEQRRAVAVLLSQHNRDIAREVALEALPRAEPDVTYAPSNPYRQRLTPDPSATGTGRSGLR